jgi:hypothetical protein
VPRSDQNNAPEDIKEIENGESNIILIIRDVEIVFQAQDFCITHVGSIEKGA